MAVIVEGLEVVVLALSLSSLSLDTCFFCSSSASKPCHGNPPALFFFRKGQEVLHPRPPCSRPPPPTCSGEAFRNRKGCSGRFTGTVRMLKRETPLVHHPLSFALSGFPLSHCDSLVCCRPVQVQLSLVPRIRAPGPLTVQEGTLAVLPLSLLLLLLLLGQGRLCTRAHRVLLRENIQGQTVRSCKEFCQRANKSTIISLPRILTQKLEALVIKS